MRDDLPKYFVDYLIVLLLDLHTHYLQVYALVCLKFLCSEILEDLLGVLAIESYTVYG